MNNKPVISHMFWRFDDLQSQSLDPVSVHIESFVDPDAPDEMSGKPFHVTVHCYGQAWTTYFGSPTGTPTEFLRKCDSHYIADRLADHQWKTKAGEKAERQYLIRIWEAVIPLMMTDSERHAKYLSELVRDQDPFEYNSHDDAPRFDKVVIVSYVGNDELFGPAPAGRFDWHIAEGKPNIDKFWFAPGVPDAQAD